MSTTSRLRNSQTEQCGRPTAVLTLSSKTSTESRPHNMTSSISSSKSSLSGRIHDVFLSFRGQDTGMRFVKRLHSALVQQRVYKDPQDEPIGPYLFKAIQESKIAIIIFTTNYADSDLCLNELKYIMKCRAKKGLVVIPIFLHVDPSDVRTQKRMYGVAFSKNKSRNIDKVESWRKALVDAANLAGFVVARDEEKAIQEIVYTITHTYLSLIPSDNATAERRVHTNLIGIERRMQDLRSLLESVSDGVRIVGISGIWGWW
ncbi:toll/interleukin-1 receptor-like protein [Bidens hawaiensis]|uniref:toll/interleukin-1 receptor-like protein n=1 Tax=Bidens hawaiensis TaxID=980011 RepID=UPI00404A40CF